MPNEYIEGASASINKTIDDIERLLQGNELPKEGKLRQKLREQLTSALEVIAKEWLEHGFSGGHIVSAKRFAKTGTFPKSISVNIKRKFPVRAVGDKVVEIPLKSKLPKGIAASLNTDA